MRRGRATSLRAGGRTYRFEKLPKIPTGPSGDQKIALNNTNCLDHKDIFS
jgi:hypothetical protein